MAGVPCTCRSGAETTTGGGGCIWSLGWRRSMARGSASATVPLRRWNTRPNPDLAGLHQSVDQPATPRRHGTSALSTMPACHHHSRSMTSKNSEHTPSSLELTHSLTAPSASSSPPPLRPMDPAAADPPCIIQALPAHSPSSSTLPPPLLVQALPALHSPAEDHAPPAPTAASSSRSPKRRPPPPPGPIPPSPRRTRSGGAPEWTLAETLALVAEVAAVDDGWSRSVSAFQKWAMVAENLAASEAFASGNVRRGGRGSKRAAGECRRRWEALAAEYGAVRRWEVRTGGSYWEMGAAARRKAGLPAEFDAEVYGAMDALIRVEEALLADAVGGGGAGEELEGLVGGGSGVEVGKEDSGKVEVGEDGVKEDESADEEEDAEEEEIQADTGNADASNNLEGCEVETNNKTENSQNIAWELANKLQENAQHIHTILNEEAEEYAGQNHAPAYSTSPDAMETTRQKADELIKSLGGLLSYLNQFTELIKETGLENVGMT